MAARLLEVGYRVETASPDGTEMILVPAQPRHWMVLLVVPDIRRYPHQVSVRSISSNGERSIRVSLAYRISVIDSGESEYTDNLFDYVEGRRERLRVRRTGGQWVSFALWLAGASVATGYVLPLQGSLLSAATILFTLFTLILTVPQWRRVYGTTLGLIALALSTGSLLLYLV